MTSQQSKIVAVCVVLAVLAIIVPFTSSFIILLVTRALVFAILVMSLDILLGFTGLASLGQAAYLGVGAYLTAILATRYQLGLGFDFWLVILSGILGGAVLAAVFGLLAIRATGVYFLMRIVSELLELVDSALGILGCLVMLDQHHRDVIAFLRVGHADDGGA